MTTWLGPDWDRGYQAGREEGIKEERKSTIALLLSRVCRDYLKTDNCPHGACQDLRDAVSELRRKTSLEAKPASMDNIAFDTGVLAERERIIKLLKSFCDDDPECIAKGGCDTYDAEIALIRGDHK